MRLGSPDPRIRDAVPRALGPKPRAPGPGPGPRPRARNGCFRRPRSGQGPNTYLGGKLLTPLGAYNFAPAGSSTALVGEPGLGRARDPRPPLHEDQMAGQPEARRGPASFFDR